MPRPLLLPPAPLLLLVLMTLGVVTRGQEDLEAAASISRNVSGFLVSKDGQFYVKPASPSESSSSPAEEQRHEEESWSATADEKAEIEAARTSVEDAAEEDGPEEEDQDLVNGWAMRARPRGFSLIGAIESAVSTVTRFLGSILGDEEDEEEADYQAAAASYKDHQLLRITPRSNKQVRVLQELKVNEPDDVRFWTHPAKGKITDILISPIMVNDVKEYLREKKIDYVVLIPDLEKVIQSQNPRMPKERRQDLYSSQGHPMTWKRYHRYKDIMGYLDHLAFKYPHLVEVMSIGKSFEGRPLKIIKVSTGANKNGEAKPSIWIDAGMHAREWISTAVATYILNQLVEKSDNYTRLLEMTDWLVMPLANPDGYEFTHTQDRLWRKTRSTHEADSEDEARQGPGFFHMITHYTKWLFGSCEGVDPNRNFNIHWGEDKAGASTDPCHDTYAGPAPFSEPETRAISNYLMKNKKTIRTYLTLHSYSQMLLVPWGFTRTRPADFDDLMSIAVKAKKAIGKVHGTEYKVGPAAELLYPTTGSSDDWAKAVAGIKNAFTMELRDRGAYGFLLPASQIVPTARETWAGVRVIARLAALAPAA